MKFCTEGNPDVSRRLLTILFDMGFEWTSGGKDFKHLEEEFFVIDEGISIRWNEDSFEEDPEEEIDIKWMGGLNAL